MRELRHDFRAVYGVSYDEVGVTEAIDLIETLPDGALYVAATQPARAWSKARNLVADLYDAISWIAWAGYMDKEKMPEPPRIVRPADRLRMQADVARRKRAREILEKSGRTEV